MTEPGPPPHDVLPISPRVKAVSASESSAGKLHPLTSIRFFGAVYVMAGHWWRLGVPIGSHNDLLFRSLFLGGACVSGFYLLSGFILGWVYLTQGERFNKRQFYMSRFARIYPIFLITLVADTPWYFLSHIAQYGIKGALIKTGTVFTSCLLMLQAWGPHFWGMDFPNWSLSVETLCYTLFPFVGFLLWRLRGVWVWIAMVLLYVGGQVLVAVAVMVTLYKKIDPQVVLYFPPLHVSTFLLGILVARLQVGSSERDGKVRPAAWPAYIALGISIATYAVTILITSNTLVDSPFGRAFIWDGFLAPVFCLLVWALSRENTGVSRGLSTKWLVILGDASYGLYLIHLPVLHLARPLLLHLLTGVTSHQFRTRYIVSFLIYLGLCIVLSIASFYWIESPARKWIARKARSQPRKIAEFASAG
jgi:peptidoglycan/LPS O-acetylase OafA/YrhL